MNGSFLSLLFFNAHRCVNEVIFPIWAGMVPFRLFWESELKWNQKTKMKKEKKE